jgi:hypothetical protein
MPLAPASLPLSLLLFAGAVVGHTVLLTVHMNVWFGHPFPRRPLKALRIGSGFLAALGPVALWLLYGFDVANQWTIDPAAGWRAAAGAYVLLCWLMGFVALPLATAYRLCRREPAALLSNDTQTIDIAARLGYRPAGRGKYRHLCWLPGNEIFRVDFVERTFRLPQLPPAWDGLTILHLTDLHLCGTPDRVFYQQVMDLCRDPEPDLVAITGDIVDSAKHHRWVMPVLGRLRWKLGAFAILGNHDYWRDPALIRRRLRRVGIDVLGNTWRQLDVRGHPLTVIGHEGPWFSPEPDLTKCPPNSFRLCLSHTPDNLPWARRHGIDLVLAGHVHGGQIRFPLIGSVFVPSRFSRRYDCGSFHEPPTLMHVGRGLAGQHPLRYNCRPEVMRIILRCGSPTQR